MNLPESTLDHIVIYVSDYGHAKAFYDTALAPLGMTRLQEFGEVCGYGRGQKPDFWVAATPTTDSAKAPAARLHVAFRAHGRQEVEAFYRAALGAGAKDNGAPGLRPMYHPAYFAAFVLDADGHNIEAVFHGG